MKNKSETNHEILTALHRYGWKIKTGEEQIMGSVADMYLEWEEDVDAYFMVIDDGNVIPLDSAYYHICTGVGTYEGKIFEGCIDSSETLSVIMKALGFKKIDN